MIIKGLRWGEDPEFPDNYIVDLHLEDKGEPIYVGVSYTDSCYAVYVYNMSLYKYILDLDVPKHLYAESSFHEWEPMLVDSPYYQVVMEAPVDCMKVFRGGEWASADEFIEPYIGMDVSEVDLYSGEYVEEQKQAEFHMTLDGACQLIFNRMKDTFSGNKNLTIKIASEGTIEVKDEIGELLLNRKLASGGQWV